MTFTEIDDLYFARYKYMPCAGEHLPLSFLPNITWTSFYISFDFEYEYCLMCSVVIRTFCLFQWLRVGGFCLDLETLLT